MTLSFPATAYNVEEITINGFGSVIASQTLDSDEMLYGNDSDLSFQEESRFALQVTAPVGRNFSATAQIITRGSEDFDPDFEWAYLSYAATDNLTVMAGRQRFNIYKYSSYVDVGYAYHWIRPPQGVYSLPFNSGNGLGFLYSRALDDVEISITYKYLGENISDYVPSGLTGVEPAPFEIKMSHLLNLGYSWADWDYGVNYGLVPELSYEPQEFDTLDTVLTGFFGLDETAAQAVMEGVRVEDVAVTFWGGYAGYDPGPWFVLAEYTYYEFDQANAFSDQESSYISAGIRVRNFTVHATYGIDKNTPSSEIYKTITNPDLSRFLKEAVSRQEEDSKTVSIGIRWEIESGVAFKADFTRYDDDVRDGSDANLISTGIDFVF